jgi:hypothetical protein
MNQLICPIFAALALTGCVSGTISSNLSESHPAHPQASESPVAIATPMLMAGSQGLVLVLPLSTNQTEMQHGHHQQTPASKGGQQPAEHKHEHEETKTKEEKK